MLYRQDKWDYPQRDDRPIAAGTMPYTAFNVMTSIVAGTLCFLVAIVVAIAHAKLAMLIASWITGYSPN